MAEIPTNEYFPETDETGQVILFHVYADTFLLTEDGGANADVAIKYDTSDTDFIKTVTTKFRRNLVSLLRSITNTSCLNLSSDMLAHLFDEDANLYVCENYKKSVYALLTENDVKVSDFYTIDANAQTIATKETDKTCNVAYFTFKLRFKYKLLDFVVQFELGNGIYQDSNEYNQNDTTINGDLTVTNDLTVNNNVNISKNLTVSCNSTFAKNVIVNGSTQLNNILTIGDDCNSHDVLIYGGDENDDTQILWDSSSSTLSVQGSLIVGSDVDTSDPPDGLADNTWPVTFHGSNGKLEWLNNDNELDITGNLHISQLSELKGNVTIGTNLVGADLTVWGSDTSGNCIEWDKATDTLRIKGHFHHGDVGSGHTFQINSSDQNKYINWNPDTYKLQINGTICAGEECAGVSFKVWGNDTGKYVHWDNTINKLSVLGNVDFGNATNLHTTTLYGSVNATEKNLIWGGPTGTLTNQGITILEGVTSIQNELTVGVIDGNHQLLVYSDVAGKNLTWVDHKLSVNGLLDVSDKTTLNGELETNNDVNLLSNTVNKQLSWTHATNTLKVTGTTELCGPLTVTTVDASEVTIDSNITLEKPVQINDTLLVGADEVEYQVKFFGSTSGKYMEWNSNELKVTGTVNITDELTTSHTVNLTSNDPAKSIVWNHVNNTLEVSGISTFTNNCTFTKDIIIDNTGTLELRGSDPANISVKWDPDTLTIKSDVDIYNNVLQLIDNDLTIKSCSNDFYLKWIKDVNNPELKINANSTFSGNFTLNDNHLNPNKSILWDGIDTLHSNANIKLIDHELVVSGDDATFQLQNTANDRNIIWTGTTGELCISSDLTINYASGSIISSYAGNELLVNVITECTENFTLTGNNVNITWNKDELESTAPVIIQNNLSLYGTDQCINDLVTWTSNTGTLQVDGTFKLISGNSGCSVEWNDDLLLINSDLDLKKGDITVYDSVDINNPVERINWSSTNNILTTTGSQLILENIADDQDPTYVKVHWNPADKLYISAPVEIDGTLITNNDITINGSNNKNIEWIADTGILTFDISDLIVNNVSHFNDHLTVDANVTFGGCDVNHLVTWTTNTNTFNISGTTKLDGDVIFDGNDGCNLITWNGAAATLESDANTVTLNGDNTHSTEWSKADNRLTVNGSLIKTPLPSDECGDVTLEMNNNNNFHINMTGNISLLNPQNACAGQEGRIVINTGAAGRTITYGDSWIFQDCVEATLTDANTFDVLVYYVYSPTQIFVRMEKNYGCPPPTNC